jgi:hypothetical protein
MALKKTTATKHTTANKTLAAEAAPKATKAKTKAAAKPEVKAAPKTAAKPRLDAVGKALAKIKALLTPRNARLPGNVTADVMTKLKQDAAERGVSVSMLVSALVSDRYI